MRRAHRFPQRLVRWTSLCVCLALVLTSLAMVPWSLVSGRGSISSTQDQDNQGSNGKARKVKAEPPQKGPPPATLPNIDEVKRNGNRRSEDVQAPPPQPSTMRSRRKPLESRRGRKVGDPVTTGNRIGSSRYGTPTRRDSDRVGNAKDAGNSAQLAKDDPPRSSAVRSLSSLRRNAGKMPALPASKLNHAGAKARVAAPPPLGDDQFIQNFFYWAFLRYPNSTELAYWNDILRTAYPQGQSAMLIANRELGKTLFESAEYAARNRSNHDYVYDLYKTFLMRDPDQAGWNDWTAVVPSYGREYVRRGFDESTEFQNLVSTLTPNGSPSTAVSSLVTARVDPFNQPGSGLAARDAEWSMPLLSLPGRAGLDLGLSLSYSSMVWTRSGPYLYFDEDNGSLSPGFRLGFPTIQEKFFDAQVGKNVYVLLTSGGRRTELRQAGSSNIYEAADSSYLQLIDNGSLLVRTADGTQLSYGWFNHEFRCVEIKDHNGNYISVSYDWRGDITNITDTLGRVITFSYDSNANPLSITQTWNGQTHTWATFGWGTVPMHPGLTGMVGTYDGEIIPVLTQVGLDDGSYFTFQYTGAGQVNLIRRYRSDNVQSSYVAYDYATTYDNCPRISQTRVWAENWNGANSVPSEVATQFSEPGDGSHQLVAPDGTVFKEFYGTGWQKGLTTQSEVWSSGVRQKWTTMAWTQDNTGVSYQTNPRVTEANIYDSSGNRRRTVIDYGGYAQYGLPNGVFEYAADGATLLRVTYTDYNLSQAYSDRHIIGLVSAIHVSDGAWQVKRVFEYDAGGDQLQGTAAAATQHDAAYGAGFITGRGNLSAIHNYDATDTGNESKKLTTRMGYDTDGSLIFTRDHLSHQSNVSYTDGFSDSVNRNTFAYPTTVTDADGFSSTLQYNYDFGAKTRAQGPPPAGQSQGVIQTIAYDTARRLDRVTTTNTGAYTRYVYGPDYVQSFGSVNNIADESYSIGYFDGAGRVWATAGNHPGSTGGYKAQLTYYDLMGRTMKQSNPIEIYGSWAPAGDDAAGWIFTQQSYDWKGRPLVTTNTDGTQKYASYSACGCAGSEVATLTDEVGRQQKVYSDVLGRSAKTEVLNWNGSVYSTNSNTYNARDQVTQVRQYQGADTSGTYQDTTMTYDGHGRLLTKHVPEQNSGTATAYSYNSDDTVHSVTDARGAAATYTYNARHLATGITYSAPSGITPTSNVSFGYDSAGNRASMTDGLGSKSYNYDQLSRMTSENRTITNLGTFTLSYQYNLASELTSVTDPTGVNVSYTLDAMGRVSGVTGSSFGGVTTYASNLQYRAWDAVKGLSYGDTLTMTTSYNNRLQPSHFGVSSVISKDYQYYADSRIRYSADLMDNRFDRSYDYDHAGRIADAFSGPMARGLADTNNRPYKQYYQYDAMSNLTGRLGSKLWQGPGGSFGTHTYTNNRNNSWFYDADGRMTSGVSGQYTYDASGRAITAVTSSASRTQNLSYDGDGVRTKLIDAQTTDGVTTTTTSYTISSTVLGRPLTELSETGQKTRSLVYLQGQVLAWQQKDGATESVLWEHRDPSNASYRMVSPGGWIDVDREAELDPLGSDAGVISPYNLPHHQWPGEDLTYPGFADLISGNCAIGGISAPCAMQAQLMESGSAGVDYLIHDKDGWHQNQHPIVPFGLGLFRVWEPDPDNPRGKAGPYGDDDVVRVNISQDDLLGHYNYFLLPQNTPCERRLAATFSDDPTARFVDVTDGNGYDPVIQSDRTPRDAAADEHNHLYNAQDTPNNNTNVFAPGGGRVVGSGVSDRQNWMSVYYKNLGGVSNVILQIWHVENYNGRGGTPQGGRILLGQMGENGNIRYGPPGSPEGWHVHINAYQWWGGIDRRGRLIGDKLGARSLKVQHRLRLSDLLCK